jgi:hypothetical protein
MPKQALDNVLPGGTAELNFYNMVVRENVAELMSAVRTGSEDSVQVWMNVDENRKITLSGKPGVNSGFDGGSVSDNFPALWIGGGAHVTLKNGMIIKGASCYEYTVPQGELALVTIYNGTLAIEDSAQVVTTTNGIGYNQADSLKTIGVQYNWESFQGHIEVNSLLTSTSVMFVQPVNDYGHCIGNADNCIGKVVLIGSAVADNFGRFDIYYDTDVMAAANETYTFDGTGCIYRIYLY